MSIICCKCGSTNVSCEAMINPNTKEFIHYTDESFDYGWCDDCDEGQVLSDADELKMRIDKAFNEFKLKFNKEPLYVLCQIIFKDFSDSHLRGVFKLTTAIRDDDDEIFFYCNGIEELKKLANFSTEDFMITELVTFY